MPKSLLIATRAKGKLKEIKIALKGIRLKLLELENINFPKIEPKENGKTYKENAVIKAKFYGKKSGLLTLADDTGLEVSGLPNKLGVKSKRYLKGSDKERNKKLLEEMKNMRGRKRRARFISVSALFNPKTNKIITTRGVCEGRIGLQEKGKYGFGFDPIFVVKKLKKHYAQLKVKEKNKISHRSKALEKMKKYLKEYEN